jgi:hypothetical protein
LLYFLTSPFSNIIGVYQIVWAVAAAEMGWTKDQMTTVAKRLQFKGLIEFNDAGWIWVKIWWNHNSARGAFSPKLLDNAKKQCAAMPPEWLDQYLGLLEIAGVDRVSIGYRYPNDSGRFLVAFCFDLPKQDVYGCVAHAAYYLSASYFFYPTTG